MHGNWEDAAHHENSDQMTAKFRRKHPFGQSHEVTRIFLFDASKKTLASWTAMRRQSICNGLLQCTKELCNSNHYCYSADNANHGCDPSIAICNYLFVVNDWLTDWLRDDDVMLRQTTKLSKANMRCIPRNRLKSTSSEIDVFLQS